MQDGSSKWRPIDSYDAQGNSRRNVPIREFDGTPPENYSLVRHTIIIIALTKVPKYCRPSLIGTSLIRTLANPNTSF